MQLIFSLNSQLTCSHASLSLNPQIFFPRFILEDVKKMQAFSLVRNKLIIHYLQMF